MPCLHNIGAVKKGMVIYYWIWVVKLSLCVRKKLSPTPAACDILSPHPLEKAKLPMKLDINTKKEGRKKYSTP